MSEYDLNNPQSDVESYLANMDGILAPLPLPPESNVEKYLAHIVGVQGVELPHKPDSRVEAYLEKLALDPPQPVTPILIEKQITNNGVYSASDDSADGYSKVTVEVPDPVLDDITITENGVYTSEHDGFDEVTVEVPDPVLDDITITENGVYTSEHDGFDEVTVEVPPPENSYQLKSITTPTSLATFEASAMLMPSLKVSVEAQQDLHGYDKPWVGGAGKNKINIDGFSDTQRTIVASVNNGVLHLQGTVTAGGNARFALPTTQSIPTGTVTLSVSGSNENIRVVAQGDNGFTYTSQYGNFTKTYTITDAVTLSYFYIDVTDGSTVNADVKIQIESGSQPTAFEPYSNICPISGWDAVVVSDVGKNKANPSNILNAYISSTKVVGQQDSRMIYIECEPNTTYTISKIAGKRFRAGTTEVLPTSQVPISDYQANDEGTEITITTNASAKYLCVFYWYASVDSITEEAMLATLQIELGSTATDYEPYNPDSYTTTISLPQTVYGGELDVVNGVLKLTKKHITLTDTDYEWKSGVWSSGYRYYTSNTITDALNNQACKSSIYEANTTITGKGIAIDSASSDKQIDVRTPDFSSLSDWKTYLASNPVDVVYELANPIIINLTPTIIKSLNGINNLSVDCGEVIEGEYFKAL